MRILSAVQKLARECTHHFGILMIITQIAYGCSSDSPSHLPMPRRASQRLALSDKDCVPVRPRPRAAAWPT